MADIIYCKHGCGRGVDASVYPEHVSTGGAGQVTYECGVCVSRTTLLTTLLEAERDLLLRELENIANANPRAWEADMQDQFQAWAQSRARSAIRLVKGE